METYTVRTTDSTGTKEYIIERYSRGAIADLLARVRLGNDKLMAAWEIVRAMPAGPDHDAKLKQWFEAGDKLALYCDQLKLFGYADCLYIEEVDGKKVKKKSCLFEEDSLGCRVCPSRISYWEKEFSNLGRVIKPEAPKAKPISVANNTQEKMLWR